MNNAINKDGDKLGLIRGCKLTERDAQYAMLQKKTMVNTRYRHFGMLINALHPDLLNVTDIMVILKALMK